MSPENQSLLYVCCLGRTGNKYTIWHQTFSKSIVCIMHIGNYFFTVKNNYQSFMNEVIQAAVFRRLCKENATVFSHSEHPIYDSHVSCFRKHFCGSRFKIITLLKQFRKASACRNGLTKLVQDIRIA